MDSKNGVNSVEHGFVHFLSALILVLRNFVYLIFAPYKTVRKIADSSSKTEVGIIFSFVVFYFLYAHSVRTGISHLFNNATSIIEVVCAFFIVFILTTKYFQLFFQRKNPQDYMRYVRTFAYSLWPNIIWFFTTSTLYYLLPPPRTTSFLGKGFSMAFIVFSTTLLMWRVILLYLAVRFSSKANFYEIMLSILGFIIWFVPLTFIMYAFHIFRIPFI